ncbi:hypothetical protein AB0I28_12675 [Phytomonospora sp. NPDC050363]|uniref:hypothetical protein n=1 Tax=Phytomonospora sp. NPDC050363 TaxID=3155642 RepID=UPI00340F1BBA
MNRELNQREYEIMKYIVLKQIGGGDRAVSSPVEEVATRTGYTPNEVTAVAKTLKVAWIQRTEPTRGTLDIATVPQAVRDYIIRNQVSPNAITVLGAIIEHRGPLPISGESTDKLAAMTGLGRNDVSRGISELMAAKPQLIEVVSNVDKESHEIAATRRGCELWPIHRARRQSSSPGE